MSSFLTVWKISSVPPSGGFLEIGNSDMCGLVECGEVGSPFGGIPRNWKPKYVWVSPEWYKSVPPSGGFLEIGNIKAP